MPGAAGAGPAGTVGKKGALESAIEAELVAEAAGLIGDGAPGDIDFEAVETSACRVALEIMGGAVAARLNADRSDAKGARLPCGCGVEARHTRHRRKTFSTALGELELPRELAGLDIGPKSVERHAEAPGRRAAEDDRRVVEPEPNRAPTLHLGVDGTGVPVRKSETAGRSGKRPDGSAGTREAKLATVWPAESRDKHGAPVRDPDSASYSAAIETAAFRDTDAEPSPFALRALRGARRRGFDTAPRRVMLGDGAAWIRNIADEHFPGAVRIVDIFHAKQHLFETAKAIHGTDSELAAA